MKTKTLGGLLGIALAAQVGVARADSAVANSPQDQNQAVNQNQVSQDKDEAYSDQQAGVAADEASSLKNDAKAKKMIAPQSVALESSLMSAKAQLEGLKSQVALSESTKPDASFMNQIKFYDRSMDNTLKDASSHASKIKSNLIKSYPQVASNDTTKNLDSSVSDLQSFYKSWSNKAQTRSYWQDKDQAKADLDSLDKRLDKAIDLSKNFNSDQFDLSIG